MEEEQTYLYYYQFDHSSPSNPILHQCASSAIPFEFPTVRDDKTMSASRYIYGTSVGVGTFNAAVGRAANIDTLVKIDVQTLISQGIENPPMPITGRVDNCSTVEILKSTDPNDTIKVFKMPPG